MMVSSDERSRLKPKVVSISLSDQPGLSDTPNRGGLSQLSPGELNMLREKSGTRWTGPERPPPPSSITVDQLSITGMSLVFNPGAFWLRRAIWLCIIVCLLVWLCVQLRLCVLRLSAGGTVRTWTRRTLTDIPLPAITLCHGNGFKKSVVLRHQPADAASWPRWHQHGYRTLNWTSFDGLDQFYQAASYGWSDMVFLCTVTGRPCSEIGTFRTSTTLLNGLCTTFNTNVSVTKRLASSQITLGLHENELLDEFEHSGWKVFLHPQDVHYNDFLFLSGLATSVKIFGNRLHEVKVFRRVIEALPNGEGKGCSTDKDALLAYQQCLGSCMMQGMTTEAAPAATDALSCPVPWIPQDAYRPNTSCRTMEELERSSMNTHEGVNETSFIAWTAECDCAPPCRTDRYKIQGHEKWHAEETSIYLSYPEVRNVTIGAVMLWLSDIEEQVAELEAYPFNSFVADVGGNLGLMLGGSLLTFVEIVDCVIASCLSRRNKRVNEMSA